MNISKTKTQRTGVTCLSWLPFLLVLDLEVEYLITLLKNIEKRALFGEILRSLPQTCVVYVFFAPGSKTNSKTKVPTCHGIEKWDITKGYPKTVMSIWWVCVLFLPKPKCIDRYAGQLLATAEGLCLYPRVYFALWAK